MRLSKNSYTLLNREALYSFAELSQSPLFRRKWPSVYEVLEDSRPQRQRLMGLYLEQLPKDGPIVLAGDHTAWPRPEAKRLRERTHEHQANGGGNLGPVSVGQGYSTLAWVPETEGSWALPLHHKRITSWESPIGLAAFQLRQVCQHLPHRPLSLWDSEYGCASFVVKTADIQADKLMRLRSNRHFWHAPPPYSGRGRPRVHGDCFKLNDPTTWREADQDLNFVHPKFGPVRVRSWHQMHFRHAAQHPLTLIQVQRLDENSQPCSTRPLWLAWVGDTMPDLEHLWQHYLRRFALEHWYRFLKQRLHWTVPKLGEPKSAECWSDLLMLAVESLLGGPKVKNLTTNLAILLSENGQVGLKNDQKRSLSS